MAKNVLIVSQVIPQWYVDTLTCALGNDVHIDIITGSDVKGNVIKSPAHDSRSFKSRLICWFKHYDFVKKWANANKSKKYDLIFAVSNPPVNSSVGLMLKKIFKAPFIYMNWDLYPQVVETTIKNPAVKLVCNEWHRWNSRNYKNIDAMLTIGSVMADTLNADLKDKIPVNIIPIAVDTDRLIPVEKQKNPFCTEHGLENKFVVLYSGKMGMGHNIEMILEAAEKLRQNEEIRFVFIGEGPKYSVVEQHIKEYKSDNILLLPLQSEEMFPYSMACGDVGIVSQESSMAHLFMPSKTYSMMACGEAIVGIGTDRDDLYGLINKYGIGETVTDNSSDTLAEKLQLLYADTEKIAIYKNRSRKIAEEEFSLPGIVDKYRELFDRYI